MGKNKVPLSEVREKEEAVLVEIEGGLGLKRRLRDMGLSEGTTLKVLHSHRPGPCVVLVGDTRLVIGYGMANKVFVQEVKGDK